MFAPVIGNAEFVLGILAAVLAVIGVISAWVAAHPDEIWAWVQAARECPWLVRLQGRYRRELDFLIRRFRPEGAFGLSFTITLVALVASTWIFGGVFQDILGQEELALFDEPILKYVADHRVPWLTLAMRGASQLGRVELSACSW